VLNDVLTTFSEFESITENLELERDWILLPQTVPKCFGIFVPRLCMHQGETQNKIQFLV
jgi:hypothetical protein